MGALTLYLQNAAAPYTPTTIRGAWDDTTLLTAKGLGPKSGVVAWSSPAISSLTPNWDQLLYRLTYILTEDMLFTGSVDGVISAREGNAAANAYIHLHAFLLQGESDNLRGTLWTDYIVPTEISVDSETGGRAFSDTLATLQGYAGDVLVLEAGLRCSTSSTIYTVRIHYGGESATDLTDGADGQLYPGWIRLSYGKPYWIGAKVW